MNFRTSYIAMATVLSAAAIMASPANAQSNLLSNGSFENSKTSIAPWSFSGFAENIAVEEFATNASVKSNAYAATCIGGTPHFVVQSVSLKQGTTYVLNYDVHATFAGSSWNYVDVGAASHSGSTWTALGQSLRIINGSWAQSLAQFGVRFTPTADVDAIRLVVRVFGSSNAYKYRVRFDDIALHDASSTSVLYSNSIRSVAPWGSKSPTLELDLIGRPGVAHVVFLGSGRLDPGVPVPNFTNVLRLDPAGLLVPMVTLVVQNDGYATPAKLTFPSSVIKSIIGVPLYYQPIAFSPLLDFRQFGSLTNLSYGN
ncbi:MAG: hypothetical protein KDC95_06920 [Planctomycetes bacterium]|nr:hypothetical protein [Planctomycetota bacterium]